MRPMRMIGSVVAVLAAAPLAGCFGGDPGDTSTATPTPTASSAATRTRTVSPGAFCGAPGALGLTESGAPMECRPSGTDVRARWRRAHGGG